MSEQWVPDGHGLPEQARLLHLEHGAPVHLRLTSPGGRSARGACSGGLGQLWTGRLDEVTCRACLEVTRTPPRDAVRWARAIQSEWERAEREDDEYREDNVRAALQGEGTDGRA